MILHKWLARIVYPTFDNLLWHLPRREKVLYLTFDDGPFPEVTHQILEILKKFRVQAIFFLSGTSLEKYRKDVPKLNYQGHRLANHGYQHLPLVLQSVAALRQEIQRTDDLIRELIGPPSTLFRPPYGLFGPALLKVLKMSRKDMVLWSLMSYDFRWEAPKVLEFLKQNIQNGDILVFHDSPLAEKTTVAVLPEFLDYCLSSGYHFRII